MGTNKLAVRVAIEKILRTKFDTVYIDAKLSNIIL
jgi:hypothetical protein